MYPAEAAKPSDWSQQPEETLAQQLTDSARRPAGAGVFVLDRAAYSRSDGRSRLVEIRAAKHHRGGGKHHPGPDANFEECARRARQGWRPGISPAE